MGNGPRTARGPRDPHFSSWPRVVLWLCRCYRCYSPCPSAVSDPTPRAAGGARSPISRERSQHGSKYCLMELRLVWAACSLNAQVGPCEGSF